jgi:hypothetical protein
MLEVTVQGLNESWLTPYIEPHIMIHAFAYQNVTMCLMAQTFHFLGLLPSLQSVLNFLLECY